MINFTVGPVRSNERVRAIGALDVLYFRTAEFSDVMLENERLMLKFAGAPNGLRAMFSTGSGTASMEARYTRLKKKSESHLPVDADTEARN